MEYHSGLWLTATFHTVLIPPKRREPSTPAVCLLSSSWLTSSSLNTEIILVKLPNAFFLHLPSKNEKKNIWFEIYIYENEYIYVKMRIYMCVYDFFSTWDPSEKCLFSSFFNYCLYLQVLPIKNLTEGTNKEESDWLRDLRSVEL